MTTQVQSVEPGDIVLCGHKMTQSISSGCSLKFNLGKAVCLPVECLPQDKWRIHSTQTTNLKENVTFKSLSQVVWLNSNSINIGCHHLPVLWVGHFNDGIEF